MRQIRLPADPPCCRLPSKTVITYSRLLSQPVCDCVGNSNGTMVAIRQPCHTRWQWWCFVMAQVWLVAVEPVTEACREANGERSHGGLAHARHPICHGCNPLAVAHALLCNSGCSRSHGLRWVASGTGSTQGSRPKNQSIDWCLRCATGDRSLSTHLGCCN